MGTKKINLSQHDFLAIPDASGMKFAIVVAEWNHEITGKLLEGAIKTLINHGALEENIKVEYVPGSFELTLGAQFMAEYWEPDSVICLGCVIQGETPHFDYICQGVTKGIADLNQAFGIPFIFGVLTCNTMQQAIDRSGGKHGNKGDEAAFTAIKMVALMTKLENLHKEV